ncbi:potassium channel LctB [Anoxybacillus vitaminiphilus]|uniref:Potassium channel LctB n=1 Tax=Paranoxybacillus vitaminiphilus TaxID=581036 RepID=A0A327Y709_9BACL|nr:potassium channel family protein [Anoxybacillus vitaminiphilus]RAK15535.1 potassium channel LctB [Anoxybacillus vitaminiphilus]
MEYILLIVIFTVLFMSIKSIWTIQQKPHRYVSLENLFVLLALYLTVLIGFGLAYTVLQINGYEVLLIKGKATDRDFFQLLQDSLYFSATTLVTVGYGDIIPVGIGRWLASAEGLLGYVLPAALIVRTVIDFEKDKSCT